MSTDDLRLDDDAELDQTQSESLARLTGERRLMRSEPQLFVCFGARANHIPTRHRLDPVERVHIGRAERDEPFSARRRGSPGQPTLTLKLPDRRVSSRHAIMHRVGDRWHIVDRSKNGTRVNGIRVVEADLTDGAIIEVGRFALLFRSAAPVNPLTPIDDRSDRLTPPDPDWATFHDPLAHSYRCLADIAKQTIPVLIRGESGTGKEVVAQALHRLSRRPGRCVAVNCAAVVESLAESTFFGHRRGAFTGADSARAGRIRQADLGTLFLDEVADLRLPAQAAILRALETRTVVPVGEDRPIDVDFRLVSATHRDLDTLIGEGEFRIDLRRRLGQFAIELPPLRARPEDIPLLVRRLSARLGEPLRSWNPTAARLLLSAAWPGNVGDLLSVLEIVFARTPDRVQPDHLPPLDRPAAPSRAPRAPGTPPPIPPELNREQKAHRQTLAAMLADCGGNVAEVSRRTGVHRQQLHRFFKRYGLRPDDYRGRG